MVLKQGQSEPFIRNIFTLNSCAPIVGSQVLCFDKETELLKVIIIILLKFYYYYYFFHMN